MVKPPCSNFRVITANFSGVRIFRIFTVTCLCTELEHTCGTVIKSVSSYTADQLIENGLLADMKDGKLGSSPKVVVVHPDGRIEEVTAKLQSLSQANSKPVDDFLVSLGVTGDAQFG